MKITREKITLTLANEAATLALGAALARVLQGGLTLHLHGDLGAGKTTLVRGMLRALGHPGKVKSPTYTLVEHYVFSRLSLYHFDFYRFNRSEEWLDAGFREHFNAQNVCAVEWPEKAGAALPAADIAIDFSFCGDGRSLQLAAQTEAGRQCLRQLELDHLAVR